MIQRSEPLLQPVDQLGDPLGGDRLQHIIDRAVLEGADGVFVVGGDEDHVRLAGERLRRLDAVHPRHADIEKDDVGLEAPHHGDCLAAIAGLTHNQEFGPGFLQAVNNLFAHQAFIVRNDGRGGGQGAHGGTHPIRLAVWRGRFRKAL